MLNSLLAITLQFEWLLVLYNLRYQCQVFKEIIFVSIKTVDFKNANHAIVSVLNQIVERRSICVRDHSSHRVLSENCVLEFRNLIQLLL